jgi:hypothetical protein
VYQTVCDHTASILELNFCSSFSAIVNEYAASSAPVHSIFNQLTNSNCMTVVISSVFIQINSGVFVVINSTDELNSMLISYSILGEQATVTLILG